MLHLIVSLKTLKCLAASVSRSMKNLFKEVGSFIFSQLQGLEDASLTLAGENSLYIRYNGAKVRQNTYVNQTQISLQYKLGKKVLTAQWILHPEPSMALQQAESYLKELREQAATLPDSPHASEFGGGQSEIDFKGQLP